MATDTRRILAGTQGFGGSASLAYFAAENTAGPTATAGTAGVQTITITGAPTGGTFTLTYGAVTTGAIAYNATAAIVQTALQAISSVGTGNVAVTGGPGPATAWVATFVASLTPQVMTANGTGLTGGTTPAIGVAQTTPGVQSQSPAQTTFGAAFLDAGLVSDSGLVGKVNESSKQLFAYGTTSPVRTLVSQRATEFDLSFLESNAISTAIYNRKALTAVTPDAAGTFTIASGGAALPRYAAVFEIVDGANKIRAYCPSLAATAVQGVTAAPGSAFEYGVTLTAYPDTNNNAIYWYYVVDALKAA